MLLGACAQHQQGRWKIPMSQTYKCSFNQVKRRLKCYLFVIQINRRAFFFLTAMEITVLSRYYFCLTGVLTAGKLRVDAELWRLGIRLLEPHSHLSLPPPGLLVSFSKLPPPLKTRAGCRQCPLPGAPTVQDTALVRGSCSASGASMDRTPCVCAVPLLKGRLLSLSWGG